MQERSKNFNCACNSDLHHTRKKYEFECTCWHPLFRWLFLPGLLKAQFICNSVIVSAIFLQRERWKAECNLMNGNLCTWRHQIIHPIRANSTNAFSRRKKKKIFRWTSFDGSEEICDDERLSKQLNWGGAFHDGFFLFLFVTSPRRKYVRETCQMMSQKIHQVSIMQLLILIWFLLKRMHWYFRRN